MRRKRAETRRAAITEALQGMGSPLCFLNRGLVPALAGAFGVHRTTIWRDLKCILGGQQYNFRGSDGELLFSVTRAYSGGPILNVTDANGNEIRGAGRRSILRQLPRYLG